MNSSIAFSLASVIGLAGVGPVLAADATSESDRAPVVYVIPLFGQMGTDIHPEIYEDVIKDANEIDPDLIVFHLKSADIDTNFHIQNDDRREFGLWQNMEMYRDMMTELKSELPRDAEQIMWIEDAVGPSTLLALGWPRIYMSEDARLWGLNAVQRFADGWDDPDVRAKMYAAWVGIASGFAEAGGHPLELTRAMIEPPAVLGVTFDGRDVVWKGDLKDTIWTVDGSTEQVARFNSDSAENVMLSQGTAIDLNDLMFLLGYREGAYERADSGKEIVEEYIEDWRRAFARCESLNKDVRDRLSGGTIQDLGAAKGYLEKILSAARRYPAVAARLERDYGITIDGLTLQIEQIRKQITDNRRNGRSGRSGGSKRGSRGGGLGGG